MNNTGDEGKTTVAKFLTDWMVPVLLALLLAFLLNRFLYFKIDVPSSSMYPTIAPGEQFFVRRLHDPTKLKRGDIVVFRSTESSKDIKEEKLLIKRLIGLPGDTVEIKGNVVKINGVVLDEPYVVNKDTSDYENTFKVPEGCYFFLGDNRPNSYDARRWKNPYVAAKEIVAIAGLRVSPLKKFGFIK